MNHRTEIPYPPAAEGEPDDAELKTTWRLLGAVPRGPGVSEGETHTAWEELSRRVGLDEAGEAASVHSIERQGRRSPAFLLRAAAVVGLLVGGAAAWYQLPVTRSAGPGERVALTLPDGSRATLNAGSTLRWRRGFSVLPGLAAPGRELRLEGEAFFQVEAGERPFRVHAGDAAVRVLGTRFNVRARSGEVRVSVAEGQVEVTGPAGDAATVLGQGEAARLASGEATPVREAVPAGRVGAWRTGGLTAVDEPLSLILEELSLRYATEVSLADPARGSTRLSVYYPELGSLESILSDLATQQALQYRRTADGWEVF